MDVPLLSIVSVVPAWLWIIPALLLLVVIHEFGHFATARALGVKVLEFGVGFPPRAFGIYTGRTRVLIDGSTRFVNVDGTVGLRRGQLVKVSSTEDSQGNLVAQLIEVPEPRTGMARLPGRSAASEEVTPEENLKHEGKVRAIEGDSIVLADMIYSVNWAPLGGFVRLAGESNPNVPHSLASKGVGTRFLVMVAGPFMNAIFPIVVFTILFMVPQEIEVGQVVIQEVDAQSPALAAGIQPGDVVLRAGGHRIENQDDLIRAINLNGGSDMKWSVSRGTLETDLLVKPEFSSNRSLWMVGIRIGLGEDSRVERRSDPPWTAVANGFVSTWELLVLFKQAIAGAFSSGSAPEFSGPIGIAQVTGEITREGGLTGWLVITILLSINLAIINILPIPMLDGGRIVFVVLEWVRGGKRVPPEKEGLVHLIGFVVLISLIVVISANDINRIIQGNSFLGG